MIGRMQKYQQSTKMEIKISLSLPSNKSNKLNLQMLGENSQKSHYQLHERKLSFQSKTMWFYLWQIYSSTIITILDNWTYEIDRGHHTDVIYMDFKKAFDTVPHKRLISKLKSLNISKEIVNWIEAFISSRRQKVAVNGKESNWHTTLISPRTSTLCLIHKWFTRPN